MMVIDEMTKLGVHKGHLGSPIVKPPSISYYTTMVDKPKGFLVVWTHCSPRLPTLVFNGELCFLVQLRSQESSHDGNPTEWYDETHIPQVLEVPGMTSATRYRATDGDKPEWLALYGMDSADIPTSPKFIELQQNSPPDEQELIQKLATCQICTYTTISEPEGAPGRPAKYVLIVLWSIPEEREAKFSKWFEEEHQKAVDAIPGRLKTRGGRYKFVSVSDLVPEPGPAKEHNYLAVHEWETKDVIEAIQTSWAKAIIGDDADAKGAIVRGFEIHRAWPEA